MTLFPYRTTPLLAFQICQDLAPQKPLLNPTTGHFSALLTFLCLFHMSIVLFLISVFSVMNFFDFFLLQLSSQIIPILSGSALVQYPPCQVLLFSLLNLSFVSEFDSNYNVMQLR